MIAIKYAVLFWVTAFPQNDDGVPGVWRWDVKTLQDVAAQDIDFSVVRTLTLSKAKKLVPPSKKLLKTTPRFLNSEETTVYRVRAYIVRYKREADGDFHILLRRKKDVDKSQAQAIDLGVELVNPDFAAESVRFNAIKRARQDFFDLIEPSTSMQYHEVDPPLYVEVTGVGFWDAYHGQHGLKNGFELHPIIGFKAVN